MTNEELYDQVLDDYVHGDIYEPQSMIRDLIMLLEPDAVERFAEMYEYSVDSIVKNRHSVSYDGH